MHSEGFKACWKTAKDSRHAGRQRRIQGMLEEFWVLLAAETTVQLAKKLTE